MNLEKIIQEKLNNLFTFLKKYRAGGKFKVIKEINNMRNKLKKITQQ